MSENLDLVRSIFAAWERGDFSHADWADPKIAFVIPDGPARFSSIGVADMAQNWRNWLSAWKDYRLETEEYRELDDGRILVLSHYAARGKTSGLDLGEVESKAAQIFEVRDRKVTKLTGYNDRQRALADLGLEE